jgi:molybdate transport system permease protein
VTELFEFSPEELVAIRLSLRVAFWAMVGSLPFGVAVALALARGRFWGKSLLNMVVHLPLVMPPVVTGYLLLLLLRPTRPLGRLLDERFGIVLAFRWTGRRWLRGDGLPAAGALDPAVDRGGRPAPGAGGRDARRQRIWVFLTVTLPLILPGIIAGMILSFATRAGRVRRHDHLRLQHPGETQTLPTAIYALTQSPAAMSRALRLTLVSIAISMAALFASEAVAQHATRRAAGV